MSEQATGKHVTVSTDMATLFVLDAVVWPGYAAAKVWGMANG